MDLRGKHYLATTPGVEDCPDHTQGVRSEGPQFILDSLRPVGRHSTLNRSFSSRSSICLGFCVDMSF